MVAANHAGLGGREKNLPATGQPKNLEQLAACVAMNARPVAVVIQIDVRKKRCVKPGIQRIRQVGHDIRFEVTVMNRLQPSQHLLPLDAFVQRVAVDQHGQVAVPTDVSLAGWFAKSALPGASGLSVIDGHVNGKTRAGVFARLGALKEGDRISVELAGEGSRDFAVFRVLTVRTAEAANYLFSQDPAVARQLNLITCGGAYIETARDFSERTIVMAKAI